MASTQKLTELPIIQQTGMDYTTVISQIKEIIESNPNWKNNWTQFYNSEAGTLLIQLMAWICDNLAVRQDLLYNEGYLATASSDTSKFRLLKQIGYNLVSKKATILPIAVEFRNVVTSKINLSNVRSNKSDFSEIKPFIYKFYAPDINGRTVPYEILKIDENGIPDYTYSIVLNAGKIKYTEDENGNKLTALQGNTVYKEFVSETSNGPVFKLDREIDTDTIKVYSKDGKKFQRVNNFLDTDVVNGNLVCYILEMDEDGFYQIRFPNRELVTYNNETLEDRLYVPSETICVFYRTCNGQDCNIPANYIYVEDETNDVNGAKQQITIINELAGYNGRDIETLENAVSNAPLTLTSLNRAVTTEDYNRLLKRCSLVLNSKTFTPDNMPGEFEQYYGKKIGPHEVYSFLIANKEMNNIPNSQLNNYPWVETNKNNVLNEKYIFGDGSTNISLYDKDVHGIFYIKDSYNEYKKANFDDKYDKGQWFYEGYDIEKDGKEYKARMLKNATVYNTSDIFKDSILKEKINNEEALRIKLHNYISDELYLADITGIDGSKQLITTKNNIIKNDVNASYTAINAKDIIDCKNYKYLKFVLDDIYTIIVDLHEETVDLYDKYHDKKIDKLLVETEKNIDNYDKYYLYLNNEPTETSDYKYSEQQKEKYGGETKEYWNEMYNYHNSKEYAGYRKGIVQLIREAIKEIVDYTVEINYNEPTGVLSYFKDLLGNNYSKKELCKKIATDGELLQKINDYTFIYKITANSQSEVVVILYSEKDVTNSLGVTEKEITLAKVLKINGNESKDGLEKINATEDVEFTKQQLMYNSMFANNTSCFADVNLQIENENERRFLKQSYLATTDAMSTSYTPNEKKDFYRIRIGNRIFAIRLDAYSIINAYNYYKRLSLSNDPIIMANGNYDDTIYDYFPYFGKGNLTYGLKNLEVIKYINGEEVDYKYKIETSEPSNIFAYLETVCNSGFSKIKLGDTSYSAGIDPNISIELNTTKKIDDETETINYVEFTLKSLVNVLEYIFSPINNDKETIYEFKNNKWYDLKTENEEEIKEYYNKEEISPEDEFSYRTVLNGSLRARIVKKGNFKTNNAINLGNGEKTNEYKSGYEYDIRFEAFNSEETLISSVSESEITTDNINQLKLLGKDTKDLFESIIGYRKQINLKSSNYVDNIDNCVETINEGLTVYESSNKSYLKINSQAIGNRSSIYFIRTSSKNTFEIIYELGLKNDFTSDYTEGLKEYHNIQKSDKAYGVRRIELYIGDDSESMSFDTYDGVPNPDLKEITGEIGLSNHSSIDIGSIIYTSSDINYKDIENIYISYVLSNIKELKINKQENFYYSSDENANNAAKPPIIGIEGESVYNVDNVYYIDKNKSDFGVKLTKDIVDDNNYYNIVEDTYSDLKIIKNKPTKVTTNIINGYDITDDGIEKYNGVAYGVDTNTYTKELLQSAAKMQIPLIFSIDELTNSCPQDTEDFVYINNLENVIAVNPGYTYTCSGSELIKEISSRTRASKNEFIKNNSYAFATKYYNSENKIDINGFDSTDNGNITFYYPDKTAFSSGSDDLNIITYDESMSENYLDLSIKLFYRMLFGTSKTNPEFYRLYPKEEMIALNSNEIVKTLNENTDEYFYCPSKKYHLKFIYRGFIDTYKTISKYGDYYIDCENNYNGFNGGYNFYIKKTNRSNFPDKEFYLHFINDRTFEPNRLTEEDKIINYMKQYQIIGTELNILKPYFKTFDIIGTVRYNANYDISIIRSGVENALKKYKLKSVKDIEIGNNVYRSDIFKSIIGVEGVVSFDLEYFGYDATNLEKYPDQKYSLNITSQSDSKVGAKFYIVSILADTFGKHGAIITYEKADISLE